MIENAIRKSVKVKSSLLDTFTEDKKYLHQPNTEQADFQHFLNQLHLDDLSQTLNTMKKLIAEVPEIDQEKVSYFKKELSSGSYQANPAKIAAKYLLEETL